MSATENIFVIEEKKLFSKSIIWDLQREYYENAGINAWRKGEVPYFITSNSVTGKTYAEIVLSILKDLAYSGETSETVYLLELGSGHGRLCYHFFKHFEYYYEHSALELPPFCYILSDFTQNNLDFLASHPQLQTYFSKGLLDTAIFDAEISTEISLQHSGVKIGKESIGTPLLVIANYFFDTIPQDLFFIKEKKLYQCFLRLFTKEDPSEFSTSKLFQNLELDYTYEDCNASIYEEPFLQQILSAYAEEFSETYILISHTGIRCIERLRNFSKEGCILITTDKGTHHCDDLIRTEPPRLATHGSFSLSVNYNAFSLFCANQNGLPLFPKNVFFHLDLGCLLFVNNISKYKEVVFTYEKVVNEFSPDDFFTMKQMFDKHVDSLTVRDILVMLRASYYDTYVFVQLLPKLHSLLDSADGEEKAALLQCVNRIRDTYYSLGESLDLSFEIGMILMRLSLTKDAITYFRNSLELIGVTEKIIQPLLSCYCKEKDYNSAIEFLENLKNAN